MSVLSIIETAVRTRSPVSFQYVRPGKTLGIRIGNPHAVFVLRLKNGEENVYLHLLQTAGVTDSGQDLPSWRQFFFNDVRDPQLISDGSPFAISETYNASWYEHPIAKI